MKDLIFHCFQGVQNIGQFCAGKLNMVRSQEENTECQRIPVICEGKEKEYGAYACNHSPLPGILALNMNGTNSPTSALTTLNLEECSPTINTEQALSSPEGG